MKKNMGTTDKMTRVIIALIIGVLYYLNIITGTLAIILSGLGIVFLLTSMISFCPLYIPFGINTCKKK